MDQLREHQVVQGEIQLLPVNRELIKIMVVKEETQFILDQLHITAVLFQKLSILIIKEQFMLVVEVVEQVDLALQQHQVLQHIVTDLMELVAHLMQL